MLIYAVNFKTSGRIRNNEISSIQNIYAKYLGMLLRLLCHSGINGAKYDENAPFDHPYSENDLNVY